jgi:hypothetical protein
VMESAGKSGDRMVVLELLSSWRLMGALRELPDYLFLNRFVYLWNFI